MALGPNSILQYKHFQSFRGQQFLNVQYYVVLDMALVGDDLSDYAQPMFDWWAGEFSPQQVSGLTHVRGELYEVNGLDFGIYSPPAPIPGAVPSDGYPPYTAVKVQQVRASRATRHGWKRIGGIPENAAVNGTLTTPALDFWQAAAETLFLGNETLESSEFPGTRDITVQPIIWGGNDPAYPLGRYSAIEDVVVSPELTTQNTRKIGRGA